MILSQALCRATMLFLFCMEKGVPALYGNKAFFHHRNGYFYAIE